MSVNDPLQNLCLAHVDITRLLLTVWICTPAVNFLCYLPWKGETLWAVLSFQLKLGAWKPTNSSIDSTHSDQFYLSIRPDLYRGLSSNTSEPDLSRMFCECQVLKRTCSSQTKVLEQKISLHQKCFAFSSCTGHCSLKFMVKWVQRIFYR